MTKTNYVIDTASRVYVVSATSKPQAAGILRTRIRNLFPQAPELNIKTIYTMSEFAQNYNIDNRLE